MHEGLVGGHYVGKVSACKIMCADIYWLNIFRDKREYCHKCNVCHWVGKPLHRDEMPLNQEVTLATFEKLEIDIIRSINSQT